MDLGSAQGETLAGEAARPLGPTGPAQVERKMSEHISSLVRVLSMTGYDAASDLTLVISWKGFHKSGSGIRDSVRRARAIRVDDLSRVRGTPGVSPRSTKCLFQKIKIKTSSP